MGSLLYYFLKTISYLPFVFWHGVADVLWILNFYVIGYRKKVVLGNLKIAFPEKTEAERKRIAKTFYRNFSDFIIESIKGFSMSAKSFEKRYFIENKEEVIDFMTKTDKGAIAVAAHVFNWEWMISLGSALPEECAGRVAYTPLSNKALNKLIKANRERFGLTLVRSNIFAEKLESNYKKKLTITGLVSDQSPKASYKYRSAFFGVDVPVFTGPETLAKRLEQSYWFLNTVKVGRSKYHLSFELLAENANDVPNYELTEIYLRKVEQMVRANPDNYLWTHKRWKHRKK